MRHNIWADKISQTMLKLGMHNLLNTHSHCWLGVKYAIGRLKYYIYIPVSFALALRFPLHYQRTNGKLTPL